MVGWVDHLTLLDNCILVEREGFKDELIALHAVAVMCPTADLKGDLLAKEDLALREAEAKEREAKLLELERVRADRERRRTESKRASAPVAPTGSLRDDDGDVLRPEAAIRHVAQPSPAVEDNEAEAPRRGRKPKKA
jgi:hypothetical protein